MSLGTGRVENFCRWYFSAGDSPKALESHSKNAVRIAFCSYFTGIVPASVGVVYGICLLGHCCKKVPPESDPDQKSISQIAISVLPPQGGVAPDSQVSSGQQKYRLQNSSRSASIETLIAAKQQEQTTFLGPQSAQPINSLQNSGEHTASAGAAEETELLK